MAVAVESGMHPFAVIFWTFIGYAETAVLLFTGSYIYRSLSFQLDGELEFRDPDIPRIVFWSLFSGFLAGFGFLCFACATSTAGYGLTFAISNAQIMVTQGIMVFGFKERSFKSWSRFILFNALMFSAVCLMLCGKGLGF